MLGIWHVLIAVMLEGSRMRLKSSFETVDMGDEIICVPVGEGSEKIKGVLKVNQEGAEILEMLTTEISKKDIVNRLIEKYENDRSSLESYVDIFLGNLIKLGLIEK